MPAKNAVQNDAHCVLSVGRVFIPLNRISEYNNGQAARILADGPLRLIYHGNQLFRINIANVERLFRKARFSTP